MEFLPNDAKNVLPTAGLISKKCWLQSLLYIENVFSLFIVCKLKHAHLLCFSSRVNPIGEVHLGHRQQTEKKRVDFTLLCKSHCKILQCFFIHNIRQFQLADSEAIASGISGSFTSFNGFQAVLFDVEMHGVIATTPVCCNATPSSTPAQRGPAWVTNL